MPQYYNHNLYAVHLLGPDGKVVLLKSKQTANLPDFFNKYISRGLIKLVNNQVGKPPNKAQKQIQNNRQQTQRRINTKVNKDAEVNQRQLARSKEIELARAKRIAQITKAKNQKGAPHVKKTVGKAIKINANEILIGNLEKHNYPISNNIGIGILSYNRKDCLERLMQSIYANTDLRRTTIFISDDNSSDQNTLAYLDELSNNENIVVIRNNKRLGIAGNSNRLLRCLSRFRYGILLNDDVEVLAPGWESFYVNALNTTKYTHFIYRQVGVYGADKGNLVNVNGVQCLRVDDKPHGAVLVFTNKMLEVCGYFDESYGLYGMEHVDWSSKASEFNLQPSGFYDVEGSDNYFRIHAEKTACDNKTNELSKARRIFELRTAHKKCAPSESSRVASISYVIPFRNFERTDAILTVVNNIRAQKYPAIDILLIEQDQDTKIDIQPHDPIKYYLARSDNILFNKSMAFNLGVSKVTSDKVVLHDADILVPNNYTKTIASILNRHSGCHIGSTVIYADIESTKNITRSGIVDRAANCDRVVGYYEGGSLACKVETYWKCGGFNQDFWGYGVEDCDFYARLASMEGWYGDRSYDFLHLFHSRVPGWNEHHLNNKKIESGLARLSMSQRIESQKTQLKKNGYGAYV